VQFGLEQVHGFEEGLLLVRGQLVEYPGQRAGGAVQPVADHGCLGGGDLDDGAPPVVGVGAAFDEACPVQVGQQAADGGQGQPEPGRQLADGDRAAAELLERGDMPWAERRGGDRGGAVLPSSHPAHDAGEQPDQAQAEFRVLGATRLIGPIRLDIHPMSI